MDGGARQEEMAERFKRKIKEHRHRGEIVESLSVEHMPSIDPTNAAWTVLPHLDAPTDDVLRITTDIRRDEPCPEVPAVQRHNGTTCSITSKDPLVLGRSETILLMFCLEHVLPFLFPFYNPSPLHGGRAWILEMMIGSPVFRQATLCQSTYFFSLAQETSNPDDVFESVLKQTGDAFEVLGQSLQVIQGSSITEHIHGAVRIMTSIMQVQRFEISISSFKNCQSHLNAALTLFEQLLNSAGEAENACPSSKFHAVMSLLGPSSWRLPSQCIQGPRSEQAAFRFSVTLLMLDDIIASTVLQDQPRLYEYHSSLLDGIECLINFEAVVGCQNWVLLNISEVSVLDARKHQCSRSGTLDVMELVHRATYIKASLEAHLTKFEMEPAFLPKRTNSILDVLGADSQQSTVPADQTSLVTRVWAHAALLYLSVVVSGWQPANNDVRYHVARILKLLSQISPPALLRTMAWPFSIAGCLAESAQETHFRKLVGVLEPSVVFGTLRKALEIMERVWQNRNAPAAGRDLAACFKGEGDLVLLV